MAEQRKEECSDSTDAGVDLSNVTQLFGRRPAPRREPPVTDEEIAEYRRIKPILLRMIAERQILLGPQGCPVMAQVLAPPTD